MSKSIAENYFVRPSKLEKDFLISKIRYAEDKRLEAYLNNGDDAWGSDDDDIYYDAESVKQKGKAWHNNYICGSFNKWKTNSLLPLGEFIKRLKVNLVPSTTQVEIEKNQYEQEMERVR